MGSRKTGRVRFEDAFPPFNHEFNLVEVEGYAPSPGAVLIEVPEKMVREVVKYVMDELALGAVVRARVKGAERSQIFERSDDHTGGDGWYTPGDTVPYPWEMLIEIEEPEIVFDPQSDDDEEF